MRSTILVGWFVRLILGWTLLIAPSAFGRDWQAIKIDGAKCGDGSPYNVYLSPGSSDKMVVYLQGGGACWDHETCFGPVTLTRKHEKPEPTRIDAFFSTDPSHSPVADRSILYLPYCTGDVFAGKHEALYKKETFYHFGSLNIEMALRQIRDERHVDFDAVKDLVVYGYSAGAIGGMLHMDTIGPYFSREVHKTAILDAPGLHFSNNFWSKFSPELLEDFKFMFARLGIPYNRNDGNLAQYMLNVCNRHQDWTIGILQGSEDVVMSALFSTESPFEHQKIVFGPRGIYETIAGNSDNCSVWVPKTPMHTFLIWKTWSKLKAGVVSAREFATDLIEGHGGLSYRDY